jgi:hypothetical protein
MEHNFKVTSKQVLGFPYSNGILGTHDLSWWIKGLEAKVEVNSHVPQPFNV